MDNNYWDNSLVTVCDSEPKLLGALIADGLVELFTVVDGCVIERNGAESSVFGSAGTLDRRIRSGEGFSPGIGSLRFGFVGRYGPYGSGRLRE